MKLLDKISNKLGWQFDKFEFAQCNCFDIYLVATEKFSGSNGQITTQLTYVLRANQLVIETTSNGPIPQSGQIFQSLQSVGFNQCQTRSKRSALLDLNVAGESLEQTDLVTLKETVKKSLLAVRPDYETNKKKVNAVIVSNSDALDINNKRPVSQIYLEISLNGEPVNFYT